MADINLCLDGTATGNGSGSNSSVQGVPNNIKDDNTSTLYGWYGAVDLAGDVTYFTYIAEVIFSPATINKVEIVHNNMGSQGITSYNWYVDLYYSGSYSQILSGTYATSGTPPFTHSQEGKWSQVTKIRVRADAYGGTSGSFICVCQHRTHELRAWGVRGGGYSCIV